MKEVVHIMYSTFRDLSGNLCKCSSVERFELLLGESTLIVLWQIMPKFSLIKCMDFELTLLVKRDSENFFVGRVSCQLNLFLIICFLDMSRVHCG